MFTITNKANGARFVWDAEKDAPLLLFDKGGVFNTSDASVAKKSEALGYTVTKDESAEVKPETKDESAEVKPETKKRATKKAE